MNNSAVKTHFDAIAPFYDKYKAWNRHYYNALKHAVKTFITRKNYTILDIGCGTGSVLHFLHPSLGMGLDISSEMIKFTKIKYGKFTNLTFKVHDIEEKKVAGKFDYILFLDVIEHLQDKYRAIKNISQTMDKETILIVSMVNPFWEPLLLLLEKLHLKMPEGPHFRISESELSSILKKYNLHIIKKVVSFPRINIPILTNLALIFVYEIKKSSL